MDVARGPLPDPGAGRVTETAAIRRIPLAQPWIGARERELVEQVLASDVLALGPFARTFEDGVARLAGRQYGVACSSGTAGLHMAVRALGITDGDEVITTPFSFVASANCLLYERARPKFVDIEEDSLGIDPALVEAAAGSRTKGILPVHVFGRPCRIGDLAGIADAHGWHLVEDACEAFGSSVLDRPAGSFGVASIFAFYPNKQLTTGEGGVIVTDDPELAATFRSLRNQGRDEDGKWLRHIRLGYNYRLDELSAAIGVAQLERIDELRAGRARVVAGYGAALGGLPWITLPRVGPGETVDWFVYVVRLDPEIDRSRLIEDLDAAGVPTRPYFSPLHLQPFYQQALGHVPGDFPVTERVAASTLAIPFSARLPDEDVRYVADAIIEAVGRQSRA
jgi:perosamine synthetase